MLELMNDPFHIRVTQNIQIPIRITLKISNLAEAVKQIRRHKWGFEHKKND